MPYFFEGGAINFKSGPVHNTLLLGQKSEALKSVARLDFNELQTELRAF